MTKPSISKLLALCVGLSAALASAQVYTVNSQTQAYVPMTGGTNVPLLARDSFGTYPAADEGYASIPLGFTFPYYGQNFTSVHVDSNGFLMFGSSTPCSIGVICTSGDGIPNPLRDNGNGVPVHNIIAGWWQDMDGSASGTLKSKQSAGQIEIEWANWGPFFSSILYTYKVTLTASGLFTIHYGPISGPVSFGTAGWENATGSMGGHHLNCSIASSDCTETNWPANTLFTIGQPVQPDIAVAAVNIANLTGGGASNISVTVNPTFQNYGQNDTGAVPFAWKAYLSTQPQKNVGSILIYTSPANITLGGAGSPTAAASATGVGTTSTPPPPGQYYVIVEADTTNVVAEASETNNVGSTASYFVSGLDLVATAVSGPANSGPGNVITVNAKWFNQGTDPAGTVTFRILLSNNNVFEASDYVLFTGTQAITGGQTVDDNLSITVPGNVPGGDWFYLLQIDPANAISEASETNNVVASGTKVTMKQADLVNTGTDFLDPITGAPTRVGYFGEPARASVKIDNIGGANGINFKVGVVVSTDATLSLLSDTIVVEQVVPLVAQGASVLVDIPFTMPLKDAAMKTFPTGNYYLFIIVDSTSAVTELNEVNNNLVITGVVQLRAPAADLTVTRVEAAASGAVGEIMPVLRTLKNIGNVNAPEVKYRYFASANQIITADDVPLQIVKGAATSIEGTTTLAIGAADTQTELVKLPASMSAGTYYLGVIIDTTNVVAETDETNNAFASASVAVAASSLRIATTQLPDAIVDRPYSYRLVALGEQGGASTWALDAAQGALPMGMGLSADGLLTGAPNAPAVVGLTVTVTNSGRDAQSRLVLRVLPTTTQVEITTNSVPAVINTPAQKYEFSLGAAGGVKPYQWRLASGVLPQNLTLTAAGLITGNPKVGLVDGANNITLEVKDSLGTTAQKTLSIRVIAPGSILFRNLQLSSGLVGENYLTDIAIANADMTLISAMQKPLTWTRQGELPDGLMFNPAGDVAVIEGKPLRAGTFTFSLSVEDAKGRNDTAEFMIRITPARFKLSAVGIPQTSKPGDAINFSITAATQASPKFVIYSGQLPPGLTMSADGKVTGTLPLDNAEGTYNFVVEATDATGATGLGAFSMEVKREVKVGGCSSSGDTFSSLWILALLVPMAMRRLSFRKGALAAAAMAAMVPATALAQAYQVSGPNAVTYAPIASGTPVTTGTPITVPFPFSYFGAPVSSVSMSQYGYLKVAGNAFTSSNLGIPHTQTSTNSYPITYMAPWWDIMVIPTGSNMRHQTFGASPNRYQVFEWNQLSTTSVAAKFSFQVILYETTGQVRFVYGVGTPALGSASVGIQGATNVGIAALSCTTNLSGTCSPASFPKDQAIDFFLPPDLTVGSVTGDQTGYTGVAYRAGAVVKNVGGRATANVIVRFYLSADATYEATDTAIGDSLPISLNPGAEAQVSATAPIPAAITSGNYFVIARVDPDNTIVEQSELNNTGTPAQMNIGAPTADLIVSSVTSPTTGAPGGTIAGDAVLKNVGNAAAGAFKYTWFISDNAVVTISDVKLSPIGSVTALAEGATSPVSDMLTLPATLVAREYWLGVCVNYDPAATPEFGITEITQVNNCVTAAQPILVSTGQLSILTTTLPAATQYGPYGLRLKATGGNGTYTWSITAGTLPPGLSLSASGDLQGTPAVSGTFAFDAKATSGGAMATASLSLMITTGTLPLAVVDQDLPAAEFSRAYAASLVAVGGKPPYVWTLKPDNRLPSTLALSPEGQIEGRANEGGDFLFGVVCTDSAGTSASKDLKLKVVPPATLHIATAGLSTGYIKQSYLQALQAVGGKPGYDWAIVRFQQLAENVTEQDGTSIGNGKDALSSALLPAAFGLRIEDGGNGVDYLRGTPKLAGLYLLTLKVVDSVGAEDFTQLMLRVSYIEGLAITTTALPDAFLSHDYQPTRIGHNGGAAATVTFSEPCVKQATSPGMFACAVTDPKQKLPPGFVLSADGTISGTPTGEPGNYAFLVKVADDSGRQDVRSLSIKVRSDYSLEPKGGCGCAASDPAAIGLLWLAGLALLRRRRA